MGIKATLTLALGLFLSISTIKAQGSSRWEFNITGGFNNSTSSLTHNSSVLTDIDGTVVSDLLSDAEEIQVQNDVNTYKAYSQYVDVSVSFRIVDQFRLMLGVGTTTLNTKTAYGEIPDLTAKAQFENVVFRAKAGLSYDYTLPAGFVLTLAPEASYQGGDNIVLTFKDEESTYMYSDYGQTRSLWRWCVPLAVKHRFGRFTPHVGIAYADYRLADKLTSTVNYVGKDYDCTIRERYASQSKIHALAGCRFAIASNLGLQLNMSLSKTIAGNFGLYFTL